ncbi:hypothetical protein BDN72DRAFT_956570 [Pluteus cervinus]|uniref:Uncharacterized protein n=1 Tax=Pluteus cervinus TaxID=181527 RepID=A0ACD3B6T6_9AGAR|nr:hypothetical protein BDN72DRAFT_956570 [Pluteus cervinus]
MYLVGGCALTHENAKSWALRHLADIDIYDDRLIPFLITRWNRKRGGNLKFIPVRIDGKRICLVVVYDKEDRKARKTSFEPFKEGRLALTIRAALFSEPEDEGIMTFATADKGRQLNIFNLATTDAFTTESKDLHRYMIAITAPHQLPGTMPFHVDMPTSSTRQLFSMIASPRVLETLTRSGGFVSSISTASSG